MRRTLGRWRPGPRGRAPRADDSPRASGCRSRSLSASVLCSKSASRKPSGSWGCGSPRSPRRSRYLVDICECSGHRDRCRRLVRSAGTWLKLSFLCGSARDLRFTYAHHRRLHAERSIGLLIPFQLRGVEWQIQQLAAPLFDEFSDAISLVGLQRPPKALTPSQNASISVQIRDRSSSQQNLYEEDHLRLPPSTGSIIVTTAVRGYP